MNTKNLLLIVFIIDRIASQKCYLRDSEGCIFCEQYSHPYRFQCFTDILYCAEYEQGTKCVKCIEGFQVDNNLCIPDSGLLADLETLKQKMNIILFIPEYPQTYTSTASSVNQETRTRRQQKQAINILPVDGWRILNNEEFNKAYFKVLLNLSKNIMASSQSFLQIQSAYFLNFRSGFYYRLLFNILDGYIEIVLQRKEPSSLSFIYYYRRFFCRKYEKSLDLVDSLAQRIDRNFQRLFLSKKYFRVMAIYVSNSSEKTDQNEYQNYLVGTPKKQKVIRPQIIGLDKYRLILFSQNQGLSDQVLTLGNFTSPGPILLYKSSNQFTVELTKIIQSIDHFQIYKEYINNTRVYRARAQTLDQNITNYNITYHNKLKDQFSEIAVYCQAGGIIRIFVVSSPNFYNINGLQEQEDTYCQSRRQAIPQYMEYTVYYNVSQINSQIFKKMLQQISCFYLQKRAKTQINDIHFTQYSYSKKSSNIQYYELTKRKQNVRNAQYTYFAFYVESSHQQNLETVVTENNNTNQSKNGSQELSYRVQMISYWQFSQNMSTYVSFNPQTIQEQLLRLQVTEPQIYSGVLSTVKENPQLRINNIKYYRLCVGITQYITLNGSTSAQTVQKNDTQPLNSSVMSVCVQYLIFRFHLPKTHQYQFLQYKFRVTISNQSSGSSFCKNLPSSKISWQQYEKINMIYYPFQSFKQVNYQQFTQLNEWYHSRIFYHSEYQNFKMRKTYQNQWRKSVFRFDCSIKMINASNKHIQYQVDIQGYQQTIILAQDQIIPNQSSYPCYPLQPCPQFIYSQPKDPLQKFMTLVEQQYFEQINNKLMLYLRLIESQQYSNKFQVLYVNPIDLSGFLVNLSFYKSSKKKELDYFGENVWVGAGALLLVNLEQRVGWNPSNMISLQKIYLKSRYAVLAQTLFPSQSVFINEKLGITLLQSNIQLKISYEALQIVQSASVNYTFLKKWNIPIYNKLYSQCPDAIINQTLLINVLVQIVGLQRQKIPDQSGRKKLCQRRTALNQTTIAFYAIGSLDIHVIIYQTSFASEFELIRYSNQTTNPNISNSTKDSIYLMKQMQSLQEVENPKLPVVLFLHRRYKGKAKAILQRRFKTGNNILIYFKLDGYYGEFRMLANIVENIIYWIQNIEYWTEERRKYRNFAQLSQQYEQVRETQRLARQLATAMMSNSQELQLLTKVYQSWKQLLILFTYRIFEYLTIFQYVYQTEELLIQVQIMSYKKQSNVTDTFNSNYQSNQANNTGQANKNVLTMQGIRFEVFQNNISRILNQQRYQKQIIMNNILKKPEWLLCLAYFKIHYSQFMTSKGIIIDITQKKYDDSLIYNARYMMSFQSLLIVITYNRGNVTLNSVTIDKKFGAPLASAKNCKKENRMTRRCQLCEQQYYLYANSQCLPKIKYCQLQSGTICVRCQLGYWRVVKRSGVQVDQAYCV